MSGLRMKGSRKLLLCESERLLYNLLLFTVETYDLLFVCFVGTHLAMFRGLSLYSEIAPGDAWELPYGKLGH